MNPVQNIETIADVRTDASIDIIIGYSTPVTELRLVISDFSARNNGQCALIKATP